MTVFLNVIFICTGISFLGSLQLGPVNYHVLMYAAQSSRKDAIKVAVGGSLPEFMYGSIAVLGGMILLENEVIRTIINGLTVLFLVLIGLYFCFKKPTTRSFGSSSTKPLKNGLITGFSLALLNPQLVFFWLTIYTTLIVPNYQQTTLQMAVSVGIGATLGAFLLLITLAIVGGYFKTKLTQILQLRATSFFVGILFIGCAFYQILLLL